MNRSVAPQQNLYVTFISHFSNASRNRYLRADYKRIFTIKKMTMKQSNFYLTTLLCLLIFNGLLAQEKPPIENKIVIGTKDTIFSKVLNEKRAIWIYVPPSYNSNIYSVQKYPVVYLLDGDWHFPFVVTMLQNFANLRLCPEMIVVGILEPNGSGELIPTHVTNTGDTTGGSENFTAFLKTELLPYIESHYPTVPYRTLMGHSLAGLFVVNSLFKHTDLFNAYIAIDPTLFRNDRLFYNEYCSEIKQKNFDHKFLYLATANSLFRGEDISIIKTDSSGGKEHMMLQFRLAEILKNNPQCNIHFDSKYYPDEIHGTLPLIANYDAFRFFFNYYKMPIWDEIKDKSFKLDSALISRFNVISDQMCCRIKPPESLVDELGFTTLNLKLYEKSLALFRLNLTNYPNSSKVYESMGDFYSTRNDYPKALDFYAKALAIRDNSEIKKKIEKIKKE
jgi:predicted alpha/beta superfamily hydrolase